jgi:hypothetical protein
MYHRTLSTGYLQAAARGAVVSILVLLFLSIASVVGWGCLVLPFAVLVGGGIGALGGVIYHWYQTDTVQHQGGQRRRRFRRRMRVFRRQR